MTGPGGAEVSTEKGRGMIRSFLKSTLAGASLIAVMSTSALGQTWDDVEIKSIDLGSGFHMLEGRGGNLGISVGEDGVFLIDDQYAPLSGKILAKIEELGGTDVVYVLNTHCRRCDHRANGC